MKNRVSIQSKLIRWLIIPLTLFALVIFFSIYYILNNKVSKFFDNRLFAIAKSIEQNMGIENQQLIIDFPSFSIDFLSSYDNDYVYYSIVDEKGDLLIGHKYLFNKSILKNKNKLFYDTHYDELKLRAISYKTFLISSEKKYAAYITVAETTNERDENINNMLLTLLAIMLFIALFTVIVTLVAVKQGLKPLHKLKNIIKKRDKRDLSEIEFDTPKELEDVVNSINILLHRSRENISFVEHFNSDVSHQLRTPLAELKVKVEQLYTKNDEKYHSFMKNIDSMKHLMQQLLLYSKSNPNNINLKHFKKVNINSLCKEYAIKIAPKVYERGFEFAFENTEKDFFIKADPILIESMLDNIIDNALKYAVDKENKALGTIILKLEKKEKEIFLSLKDEGLGVDENLLGKLFTRNYRADNYKKGFGLGLNIVKQIATLHNAKINASNENGFKVTITFEIEQLL